MFHRILTTALASGILCGAALQAVTPSVAEAVAVTLVSPTDGAIRVPGNVTFVCDATDDTCLKSVTLYHNIGQAWGPAITQNLLPGMQLLMHLDESANPILDSSGNNRNGTLYFMAPDVAPPTYIPNGKINGAYSFNGVSQAIQLPSSDYGLPGQTGATMAAWVRPNSTLPLAASGSIVYIDRASGTTTRMLISVDGPTSRTISVKARSAAETLQVATTTATIPNGAWSHIVGVIDLTAKTGTIYIDGQLSRTVSLTGFTQGTFATSTATNPAIGAIPGTPSTYSFKGDIDEVSVYNRVLSPTEVQQLYAGAPLSWTASFSVSVPQTGTYLWNCQAQDVDLNTALAPADFTLNVSLCGDGHADFGEQCDDGNTADGDCCSSTCQYETAGSPCQADTNVCTDDVCDGAGACTHPNNTASCDDGQYCTVNDVCADGACSGAVRDCSDAFSCTDDSCDELGDTCVNATNDAHCPGDGNVCTDDVCAPGQPGVNADGCYPYNTASCEDGLYCTVGDVCAGGVCTTGSARNCSDAFNCTDDSCDEGGNTCVNAPNNAHCPGDGNVCTNDVCAPGQPGVNADGCYPYNAASCEDGLYCTVGDVCAGGVCTTGSARNCSDAFSCTDDSCDEGGDTCVNAPNNVHCPGDGNVCTNDVCAPGQPGVNADGCYPYNTASCDDGQFCDGSDTCSGGGCTVHAGYPCGTQLCDETNNICVDCLVNGDCNDGNVCTDDTCVSGACQHVNNNAACYDGLFCTLTDTCSGGSCVGSGDRCPGQNCDEQNDVCVPIQLGELSAGNVAMSSNSTATVVVSGSIAGASTFGVNIQLEILSRVGNTGTVTFSAAPPVDITQLGDPWPGLGTFSAYDTNLTGSALLNGAVDDNGTFVPGPVTFSGPLAGFPVTADDNAGGIWDVVLATSAGDSAWEGLTTGLVAGTITVSPPVGLRVNTLAIPPGGTNDVVVSGTVENRSTYGVTVLVELIPRAGNVGTLTFTTAPPVDVYRLDDPWPGVGTFTAYDTDSTGSVMFNGCVDDNGSYIPAPLNFSGDIAGFPVTASMDADGVWDVTLDTSDGASYWEELPTALMGGTITVTPDACVTAGDCSDGNTCTSDSCKWGLCEYTTVVGSCDDGNLCTEGDTCVGTVCVGTAVDCSGLDDLCSVGVCNPATGACQAVPVNEGQPCNDEDLCTLNDVCTAGVCSGIAVDCSAFTDACHVGTCNPSTGACQATPANEGGACDDGDACTQNDVCAQGVCQGTVIPGCVNCNTAADCNDGNVCTTDTCPAGACAHTNNGLSCDDGNSCTQGDVCAGGVCAGTFIPGCQNCTSAAECNDGNVCTSESCPAGVCVYTNLSGSCNDGNRCTLNDACSAGACVGTPVNCTAWGDDCNLGVCNPSNGLCYAQPTNEGGACDDGFACTEEDVCADGACVGTLTVPPLVHLTWAPLAQTVNKNDIVRVSVVAVSGTCIDQPTAAIEVILNWNPALLQLLGNVDDGPYGWYLSGFPNDSGLDGLNAPYTGVPGNDGNALYQAVADFQAGADVPPAGMVVTTFEFRALDAVLSTSLTMPPSAGLYSHTRVLGADFALGQDITGTLGTSAVRIIECGVGADCNDGNVCTTDTCSQGICQNTNNTAPCSDGLFCTSPDTCSGGVCVGGTDPCSAPLHCSESLDACVECVLQAHCNDNNVCTNDTCLATGACQHTNNTLACNDGLFCTLTDRCTDGACVGSASPCTVAPNDVCDEASDSCVDCLTNADCNDGNICTNDTCNTSKVCVHSPNTAPCNDGLFCTANDTCSAGACAGGANPCPGGTYCSEALDACVQCLIDGHCTDANTCTTDSCINGTCYHTNNTLACNDGVFCNGNDTCSGGNCSVHAGNPCTGGLLCDEPNDRCVQCFTLADCADDGVACTEDRCDNGTCVHEPKNSACDDGVFCNGAEFCHATLGCRPAVNPCDDPALCDESNDSCACQEPVVVGEGPRYFSVTPRPGSTPVALLVVGMDPDVSCVSLYVQSNGTLGTTPVYRAPGGLGWSTVHVRGMQVVPLASYQVQTQCDTHAGIGLSTATSASTWGWADADNSGGLVDFDDIRTVVDGFRGVLPAGGLYRVDLWGTTTDPCVPQLAIDFNDITSAVEAFRQIPYHCSDPCP